MTLRFKSSRLAVHQSSRRARPLGTIAWACMLACSAAPAMATTYNVANEAQLIAAQAVASINDTINITSSFDVAAASLGPQPGVTVQLNGFRVGGLQSSTLLYDVSVLNNSGVGTLQTDSLSFPLAISSTTLASSSATTLTLTAPVITLGTQATVKIGSSTLTGDVVLIGSGIATAGPGSTLEIAGGRLFANGSSLSALTSAVDTTKIDTGATLAMNNNNVTIKNLQGDAGSHITNTLGAVNLTVQSGNYQGDIVGLMGLTKTTAGTLVLNAATPASSTYTGDTNIQAGTIRTDSAGSLSQNSRVNISAGATLDLNDTTQSVGSLAGAGSVVFNDIGSRTLTIGSDNTNSVFTGTLAGGATLAKTGSGVQTLSGSGAGFTGATSISDGVLRAGAVNVLSQTGFLSVFSGSTFDLNGFDQTVGAAAGNGNISLGAGTLTTGSLNTSNSLGGVISGTGGLAKLGTGTLSLQGANTYSGATTVSAGTLRALATNTFSAASATTIATGATLDLNNFGEVIGSLAGSGNVALNGGVLTSGGNNASTAFSGNISGPGSIVKLGTGTLSLSGTNNYAGSTSITGKLNVAGATSIGTGVFQLENGELHTSSNTTFNNDGLLFLSNSTNTVSAATGTLAIYNGSSLSMGSNTLVKFGSATDQGVVQFNNSTSSNAPGFAMEVAGGTFRAGNAFFSNASINAAAITVDAGATLDLNSFDTSITNLQGSGTVSTGVDSTKTLTLFNGNFSGNITGSSALSKNTSATTVLAGNNTYTGATNIALGTVQVGDGGTTGSLGSGAVNNSASLVFNRSNAATVANNISGTGTLTQSGSGNLILTGANTYTGATNVNAGTLSANGSLASIVAVNSGGTLGGNGSIAGVNVLSGGVLAPGNSIGTLTVNGNATIAAGSTYRVEADAAGNADKLQVIGAATINGGTVDVRASAGTYQASTQYNILSATAGRTGTFTTVTSNLAFLTPSLSYDPNNVYLSLVRNDATFLSVARTPNQIATSNALQSAGNTGDFGVVQTSITGLSADQARAAYDSASGAGLVAMRRAGADFANNFNTMLQARVGAMQGTSVATAGNPFGGKPIVLAANDRIADRLAELSAPVSDSPQKFSLAGDGSASSNLQLANGGTSRGLWVRGYGGQRRTDGDGNAAANRSNDSGLSVGFDAEVKENLIVGGALTAGTSRISTDNNETGKLRGRAIAIYASYLNGPWTFSGSATASTGKNHMDRNINFGAVSRVASSNFDSDTFAAYGQAMYAMPMNGWTLQPLAGLSLSRNRTDAFNETGAGALSLQVAGETVNSSKSFLGAKASIDSGRVTWEPKIVWAHEFSDLNAPMTAQFSGAAASSFQVSGVALKRDSLILGLGATGSMAKGVDLFADFQAEYNSQQRNMAVLVGLRSRW